MVASFKNDLECIQNMENVTSNNQEKFTMNMMIRTFILIVLPSQDRHDFMNFRNLKYIIDLGIFPFFDLGIGLHTYFWKSTQLYIVCT